MKRIHTAIISFFVFCVNAYAISFAYAVEPFVAAGNQNTVGLKIDGTVVSTGFSYFNDVSSWQNIVQVAAGSQHVVGLKADGTVVALGQNTVGECDTDSWNNIKHIYTNPGQRITIGIKNDGTVVATGTDCDGQCDVSTWNNIVQIATEYHYTVGLKNNGKVVIVANNASGSFDDEQQELSTWNNIIQIVSLNGHTFGLKSDGTVVSASSYFSIYHEEYKNELSSWSDIKYIDSGYYHLVGLKNDGTVVATGTNNQGQCDVSSWDNITQISVEGHNTVGLRKDGTVVAVGSNSYNQCDVSSWNDIVQIATSCYHTVGLKSDGTVVAVGQYKQNQLDVHSWNLKEASNSGLSINNTPVPTIFVGGLELITIEGGTGDYNAKSSSEDIASVLVFGNTLQISGMGIGSAVVTIEDESSGESLSIDVQVEKNPPKSEANIILIHGLSSNASTWNELASKIAQKVSISPYNTTPCDFVEIAVQHTLKDNSLCLDAFVVNEWVPCEDIVDDDEQGQFSMIGECFDGDNITCSLDQYQFGIDANNFIIEDNGIAWKSKDYNPKIHATYPSFNATDQKKQYFKDHRVFAINFSNNKHLTFDAQGRQLKAVLDDIKEVTGVSDFILIGHSMGGLAARAYIQREVTQNIKMLITINTPHFGGVFFDLLNAGTTELGYYLKGNAALNLDPDSKALAELNTIVQSKYDGIQIYHLGYSDYFNVENGEAFHSNGDGIVPISSQMGPTEINPYRVIFSPNGIGSSYKDKDGNITNAEANLLITDIDVDLPDLPHTVILDDTDLHSYILSLLTGYSFNTIADDNLIQIQSDSSFELPSITLTNITGVEYRHAGFSFYGSQNGSLLWSLDLNKFWEKSFACNPINIQIDGSFGITNAVYGNIFDNPTYLWAKFEYFGQGKNGAFLWQLVDYGVKP